MTAVDWPYFGLTSDLDWQEGGLCAQLDPEVFFPEPGGSNQDAKDACLSCDVRQECMTYALDHPELLGIWGGLTAWERKRLRRGAA